MSAYNLMKVADRKRLQEECVAELLAVKEGRWPRDLNDLGRWIVCPLDRTPAQHAAACCQNELDYLDGVDARLKKNDPDLEGWDREGSFPSPPDRRSNMNLTEMLAAKDAKAKNGAWTPASGGTEKPFTSRNGKIMLYCFQATTGKHAYLDVKSDIIMSEEEAQAALGL